MFRGEITKSLSLSTHIPTIILLQFVIARRSLPRQREPPRGRMRHGQVYARRSHKRVGRIAYPRILLSFAVSVVDVGTDVGCAPRDPRESA